MPQRRDNLIHKLEILQRQFPEFSEILQVVIDAIEREDIDMQQEDDDW